MLTVVFVLLDTTILEVLGLELVHSVRLSVRFAHQIPFVRVVQSATGLVLPLVLPVLRLALLAILQELTASLAKLAPF